MAIINCLDLCVSHVTAEDQAKLDGEDCCFSESGPRKANHEYGWILFLGPDGEFADGARAAGMSDAFLNIIKYAQEHECDLIHFDRDADIISELPTFEW